MNVHPFLFLWDEASCTRKQELFFCICHGSGLSTYAESVPPRSEQLPGSLVKVLILVTKCNWSSCEKLLEILLKQSRCVSFCYNGHNNTFTYINFSCFICQVLWSGFLSTHVFHSSGLLSVVGWRVMSVPLTQGNALDLQGLNASEWRCF